jgi:hypothetical protein
VTTIKSSVYILVIFCILSLFSIFFIKIEKYSVCNIISQDGNNSISLDTRLQKYIKTSNQKEKMLYKNITYNVFLTYNTQINKNCYYNFYSYNELNLDIGTSQGSIDFGSLSLFDQIIN